MQRNASSTFCLRLVMLALSDMWSGRTRFRVSSLHPKWTASESTLKPLHSTLLIYNKHHSSSPRFRTMKLPHIPHLRYFSRIVRNHSVHFPLQYKITDMSSPMSSLRLVEYEQKHSWKNRTGWNGIVLVRITASQYRNSSHCELS